MSARMILVVVASFMVACNAVQAASMESSRADLVEPLQPLESGEIGNQLEAHGTAESELDDVMGDEAALMGASPSQQQEQRWADAAGDQDSLDSNIENAKVELGQRDLAAAAGHHHHHHGHYVHGKMSMGAHSGHKGAFGWHAKFPVGGKGR